jgi:hypothetical protein
MCWKRIVEHTVISDLAGRRKRHIRHGCVPAKKFIASFHIPIVTRRRIQLNSLAVNELARCKLAKVCAKWNRLIIVPLAIPKN